MLEQIREQVAGYLYFGLVGAFGGVASYVYMLSRGEGKFSFLLFLANMFLAFFTGKMVSTWLPELPAYPEYRDGLVMASGFCAYPILRVVETRFGDFLMDHLLPKGARRDDSSAD